MLLTKSSLLSLLVAPCDAPAGGAAGGGVSVAGGASAVCPSPAGGASAVCPSPAGGASAVCPSPAGGASAVCPSPAGGASAVCPSPAGGASVGQLPLASGVEPSGHDCAYEGCSIDDDCTVRTAAVTRITLIIIDILLYIICSSCLS